MPLVECKECKNWVSTDAPTCPHCGNPDPAVSYQEEELIRKIEDAKEKIEYYRKLYEGAGGGTWLGNLVNRDQIERNRGPYMGAIEQKQELEDKLAELRAKKKYK